MICSAGVGSFKGQGTSAGPGGDLGSAGEREPWAKRTAGVRVSRRARDRGWAELPRMGLIGRAQQ